MKYIIKRIGRSIEISEATSSLLVYYLDEEKSKSLDPDRCGKWMYFFSDVKRAAELCMEAVEKGVVAESKHSDEPEGVCCFYLNGDDQDAHKSILQFFLEHDLIRKTKKGKLYNISFKYDNQTRNGEYGDSFQAEIKLDQFLNLETGEWMFLLVCSRLKPMQL